MPLQNRVSPFGELFATSAHGLLMGNRGGRDSCRWRHGREGRAAPSTEARVRLRLAPACRTARDERRPAGNAEARVVSVAPAAARAGHDGKGNLTTGPPHNTIRGARRNARAPSVRYCRLPKSADLGWCVIRTGALSRTAARGRGLLPGDAVERARRDRAGGCRSRGAPPAGRKLSSVPNPNPSALQRQ